MGFSTLYGDTAGAYAPIKDVLKSEVWALWREINRRAGFERVMGKGSCHVLSIREAGGTVLEACR